MDKVLWIFLGIAGPLILFKLVYALSTALVLPRTRGAMFVGTSRRKIRAILEELSLSPSARVVDLGCGDGRFLRAVWRRYRVRAVGYEINPFAWVLARSLNALFRVPAEVRFGDFMQADLSGYDLIFCYLFPDVLPRLEEKIRREARPGTFIVSANFPLPGLKPQKVLHLDDPVYFYRL
ncbi:MAG TPA: class I SAM-dependent methyltransferase [Thermosulfurimonas dismutans]|uniref:Class I SAM-dependent methyltransferase n=1 Tax=Thermosulfurimonas dismutans TaxID=999894 RepID=A0A7C3GLR0_9BACT|nr:class I SAM-dependent methyltransferase [Thermosulfurimonas dismutans]